eukprot:GHVU01110591.1.p2 GENE.GHVU01110591.1~~GHVU01110591.1.p2  ORF type:complete len:115 (+),score=8.22 GHVU01110591.1:11-355(+)
MNPNTHEDAYWRPGPGRLYLTPLCVAPMRLEREAREVAASCVLAVLLCCLRRGGHCLILSVCVCVFVHMCCVAALGNIDRMNEQVCDKESPELTRRILVAPKSQTKANVRLVLG